MKKALFVCFTFYTLFLSAQNITGTGTVNYLPRFTGSTTIGNSAIFQNGNNIGVGTTTPAALLESSNNSSLYTQPLLRSISSGTNISTLFIAEKLTIGPPPTYTPALRTQFIVRNDGKVGIGTATPSATMQIKHYGYGTNLPQNPAGNPVYVATDDKDGLLWGVFNTGDANISSGYMIVRARPDINGSPIPALSVVNQSNQTLNFAVAGNGGVMLGLDISSQSVNYPVAQLEVRHASTYDYTMRVGNFAGNADYFTVRNNGAVGIGLVPHTTTTLSLYKPAGDTYLDIMAPANNTKAIRFMANSNTQARHVITETNGDFVIDPGVANGGGNDRLVVSGDERVTGKLTVGAQSITSGTHTDAKLFVDGKVAAKSCIVTINNWADDVFNKNYPLLALTDVEKYIDDHCHLPSIPSEEEVIEKGIDIGSMNAAMLRKIEELTLYVIQQQKEIDYLEKLLIK